MRVIPPNKTDAKHVAEVVAEMRTKGAPAIHAVWHEGYGAWVAIEGSHRIAAAVELGLTPEMMPVEGGTLEDYGCDDSGEGVTVEQVVAGAWRRADLEVEFE